MLIYPRAEVTVTPAPPALSGSGNGGFTTAAPLGVTVTLQRGQPAEAEVRFPLLRSAALAAVAVGNRLAVSLGNDVLGTAAVFDGAVTELAPNMPLVVKAKDAGGAALANPYNAAYENKTWADVARDAATRAGMTLTASAAPLAVAPPRKFRVDGQTPAAVLARACEATGWVWQVLPGSATVWFGPRDEAPPAAARKVWSFAFGSLAPLGAAAVAPNVIRADLKWKESGRYRKVVCTLVDAGWEHAAATGAYVAPGFKEGDAVLKVGPFAAALSGSPGRDRDAAVARAYEEYLKVGAGGFEGTFETFLNPFVIPGATVRLTDNDHPERTGWAVVAKNVFKFSPEGGGRMTVEAAATAEGVA